jgi:hypothetical protein
MDSKPGIQDNHSKVVAIREVNDEGRLMEPPPFAKAATKQHNQDSVPLEDDEEGGFSYKETASTT